MQPLAQSLVQYAWAWLAIATLGVYHGANPGMGWLFAVSNGMQERRSSAVFGALPPIALGHFLAMAAVLLPFVSLELYLEQVTNVRAAAGLLLVAFGLYKLLHRRHPRVLAHVGPSHLVAWSFLSATAHGAGLMLVPVVLGMGQGMGMAEGTAGEAAHRHGALAHVATGSMGLTLLVGAIHTLAMVLTGGAIAWLVYRYVGVGVLRRAWFNLDLLWGVLLIVVGTVALILAAMNYSRGTVV